MSSGFSELTNMVLSNGLVLRHPIRHRLQTPDLTTAVDLLVTGDFKSGPNFLDVRLLPSAVCQDSVTHAMRRFQSDFLPAKLLTVQGRSDTLQAMNELISYRLRVEEELPSRLQVVSIRESNCLSRSIDGLDLFSVLIR